MFTPTVNEVPRRCKPTAPDVSPPAAPAADAHERQRARVLASLVRIPAEREGVRR